MIDDDGVITTPFLRTRYNYDTNAASDRVASHFLRPTRTQQQFLEETDINTIVKKFGLTGTLPQNLRVPLDTEFVDVLDYQSALNKLIEADDAFMKMPADIRTQFQNDAGRFVDFVSNPDNVDQCRKWGLATPAKTAPEPFSVRVIADTPELPLKSS